MSEEADKLPKSAGKRPQPKGGSRKGKPNKITADVKAMVLTALEHAGGAEYLCMQAYDNPKAFLALLGRVIPTQVTGLDGAEIVVMVKDYTGRKRDAAD